MNTLTALIAMVVVLGGVLEGESRGGPLEIQIPIRDGSSVRATLILPQSPGPVPAALFIPGYVPGHQNQEEEAWRGPGGADSGQLIAEFLAGHGVAVLRIPIAAGGRGNEPSMTANELAGRAEACINYLRHRPEIDAKRVGIIGQSIGGFVAVTTAAQNSDPAFLITLATPMESIDSAFFDALERLLRAGGAPDDERTRLHDMMAGVFNAAKKGESADEIRPKLDAFLRAEYGWIPQAQRSLAGKNADEFVSRQIEDHLRDTTSPMFTSLVGYDVTAEMARVHCPMLILFAQHDFKVEPERSARIARVATEKAKDSETEIRMIADADHFFRQSPAPSNQAQTPVAPQLLEVLSMWLEKHAR